MFSSTSYARREFEFYDVGPRRSIGVDFIWLLYDLWPHGRVLGKDQPILDMNQKVHDDEDMNFYNRSRAHGYVNYNFLY